MNLSSKVAKRVVDARSRNESPLRTTVGVAIDLAFLVFAIHQLLAGQSPVVAVLYALMIVFVGQRIVFDVIGMRTTGSSKSPAEK